MNETTPTPAQWNNGALSVLLPEGSDLRNGNTVYAVVTEVCKHFTLDFTETKAILTLDLSDQKTEHAEGLLDYFRKQEGWIVPVSDDLRATLFHQEVVTTPNPAQESTDEEKKDDFKDVERDDLIDWGGAPFDDDDDPLA